MVTLSVTPTRIANVLRAAASLLERAEWDPYLAPLMDAIDRAADYTPGCGSPDAETTSLAAWDAVGRHLGQWPGDWERTPIRTAGEVISALHAAADEVTA